MTRPNISMTPAEVESMIGYALTAVLAVNSTERFEARVVECASVGGTIRIESSSDEKLWAAIENDPRVCLTFEEFPNYQELRGVVVHGRATMGELRERSRRIEVPLTDDVVSFDFGRV